MVGEIQRCSNKICPCLKSEETPHALLYPKQTSHPQHPKTIGLVHTKPHSNRPGRGRSRVGRVRVGVARHPQASGPGGSDDQVPLRVEHGTVASNSKRTW